MYKYILPLAILAASCGGVDYSKTCTRITATVARVDKVDKQLRNMAQGFLDQCNGNTACVDKVIDLFLPVNVLIQSTYQFAESLQRGGVCSEESVATLEATAKEIEEIYNAYTK